VDNSLEGFHQAWAGLPQLLPVSAGEPAQAGRSFGRKADADLAAIVCAADPFDQAAGGEAVDQPDGAVVANQKVIGELADGGAFGLIEPLNGEEDLVLLRLEAFGAGGLLAEMDETADEKAEPAEGPVIGPGHIYIVPRYFMRTE
jgi:hypothetical protein